MSSLAKCRMKRVRWLAGALAALCVGSFLPACSSGGGNGVSGVVNAYLSAWRHRDYRAMAKLVDRPPPDFVSLTRAVVTDLGIRHADYVAGRATQNGRQAAVPLRNHFVLDTFGAWHI